MQFHMTTVLMSSTLALHDQGQCNGSHLKFSQLPKHKMSNRISKLCHMVRKTKLKHTVIYEINEETVLHEIRIV